MAAVVAAVVVVVGRLRASAGSGMRVSDPEKYLVVVVVREVRVRACCGEGSKSEGVRWCGK